MNILLDTGAGISIIDSGTIDKLDLTRNIVPRRNHAPPNCIDTSGHCMDIIGTIKLNTRIVGTQFDILHRFNVLGVKSSRHIIIGRDFMKNYKKMELDFLNNHIRLGNSWVRGIAM